MSGLIKSDFKKLFKNRSLFVCSIVACVVGAFTVFFMDLSYELSTANNGFGAMLEQYSGVIGSVDPSSLEAINAILSMGTSMGLIDAMLSDSSVQMFIAICVCLYIASEYSHGTLKNTVSRGFSRHKIYFSKSVVSAVASVIIATMFVLGSIITSLLCSEITSDFNIMKIIVEYLAYIVLVLATSSMFLMISILIRKTGIAIVICIATPMGVQTLLALLAGAIPNLSDYTRFWLPSTFGIIGSSYSDSMIWLPIIIGLVYIAATYVAGTSVFAKHDIK